MVWLDRNRWLCALSVGGFYFWAVTVPFVWPVRSFWKWTVPFFGPFLWVWLGTAPFVERPVMNGHRPVMNGHRTVFITVRWPFVLLNKRSSTGKQTVNDRSKNRSMTVQTVRWPFVYNGTVRWPFLFILRPVDDRSNRSFIMEPFDDRSFWVRSARFGREPFRSFDRSVRFGSVPVR